MEIDNYESPVAERLLLSAQDRHSDPGRNRRVLITEGAGAAIFLVSAGLIALLVPWHRHLELGALAATVCVYMIALRIRFPVGGAWTEPTQLAFVPMLFVLPIPLVPLIVAACSVLDLWGDALKEHPPVTRPLARVADCFYSLGPVLVLVLSGEHRFAWGHWPLYAAAFGAQVLFDATGGLTRSWFSERIPPREQLPMLWLYGVDACLTYVGLLIAATADRRPGLVLLALPLIGLLWVFARERQKRLEQTLTLSTAYRGTALLLGDIVEADDHYTGLHSRDVVDLSIAVAQELRLDPSAVRNVEFAALLHDVGKIHVPKEIINKPGKLDEAEWEIIRQHTVEGEKMLKQVGGRLASVGRIVRSSHEHFDGGGYPDGLVGDEIPIEARVVTACDAYSAMTTDRSYRAALPVPVALEELNRCAGTQFDPGVVAAMTGLLSVHEPAVQAARHHWWKGRITGRRAEHQLHEMLPDHDFAHLA